jgi:O-antigen ligase
MLKKNIKKKSSFNFICIICACLIPLLVTGPFLPDLVVSLLSLWFLFYSLKNKIYAIYKNYYFYTFISFCLICILSSLLSDNVIFSLKNSLFYFRIGIFALLISYLIDQNKKILEYFYYAFLITFSALIVDGYFQYITGSNLFGYKITPTRVSSFFGNELILGSYLARLYPLFFALFLLRDKKNPLEIYIIFILSILIYVLIFLAGERASFILFSLSIFFIIFFVTQYKWLRLFFLLISFVIISCLIIKKPELYQRYIHSTLSDKFSETKNSQKIIFSKAHDSIMESAWKMFVDKPILGHGPKLFRIKCQDPKYYINVYSCSTHPHNFYIQLLAETGILGFSFLVGLLFYFLYLMMRHVLEYFIYKRSLFSDYQICLLAGLLITIWPVTTNGNFFSNYLMLFYSLQMGFFKKNL